MLYSADHYFTCQSDVCNKSDNMTEAGSVVLHTLRQCNNFLMQGLTSTLGECRPLIVAGKQVGLIRPDVAASLVHYPHVFTASQSAFILNSQLDTYKARSEAVASVLSDLRKKDTLAALRTWRNECYNVYGHFGGEPLFQIERSAVTALGVRAFGVSVTGYSRLPDGSVYVWLQKRADNKPTYPGMLDTMVGGGITAGLKPSQVLVKESAEEASIPPHIIANAKSAGCVSFFTESTRGLHANTEFVYDLELPRDFVPTNSDGEVQSFEAVPLQDLLSKVMSQKYKLTSIPIAIDFLIRHGALDEDNLPAIQELLHVPLHHIYNMWPYHGFSSTFCTPPLARPLTPNSSICSNTEDSDDFSDGMEVTPRKVT